MYAANLNIDGFLHDSQRPTALVVSGRQFYTALRNGVNSFFARLLLFLALPFAWGFVYYFRRRLQNRLPNGIHLTFENYAHIRHSYDALHAIVDDLDSFQKADIQSMPFWLRGFIREIQCLAAVICQATDAIKSALDSMNNDFSTSKHNVFQPISDDVLWKNRPKVYQYRL